jgi:hypothetical protein
MNTLKQTTTECDRPVAAARELSDKLQFVGGWVGKARPGGRQTEVCRTLSVLACLTVFIQLFNVAIARGEDGYRLWLRYDRLPEWAVVAYRKRVTTLIVPGKSATFDAIRTELETACGGLLGAVPPIADKVERDGALVVGTPASSPVIASLKWERQLEQPARKVFELALPKSGQDR